MKLVLKEQMCMSLIVDIQQLIKGNWDSKIFEMIFCYDFRVKILFWQINIFFETEGICYRMIDYDLLTYNIVLDFCSCFILRIVSHHISFITTH